MADPGGKPFKERLSPAPPRPLQTGPVVPVSAALCPPVSKGAH